MVKPRHHASARRGTLRWLTIFILTLPLAGAEPASIAVTSDSPAAASATPQPGPSATRRSHCSSGCRGLGIEKVKVADEHCGLAGRKRKRAALGAACDLADANRQELQAAAELRARESCAHLDDGSGCTCEGGLRRWENVYTHVLSQRCWAECGWAYVVDCQPREG